MRKHAPLAAAEFSAFGSHNSILWESLGSEVRDLELRDSLISEARRIHGKYSRYEPESVLSQINASAGRGPHEVDQETAGLLNFAHEMYQQSGGLFDISSGVLRRAWDFKNSRVPTQAELEALKPLIGWDRIKWSAPWVELPTARMELDFGGIGKEYAADRLAGLLRCAGTHSALINLGGDLVAVGTAPGGRPWRLGIKHPRVAGAVSAVAEISESAVATSGDYERYFELGGRRYSHILNPKTGFPDVYAASATVIAARCLVAGAISTTLMLMRPEERDAYVASLGVEAVLLGPDGKTLHQGGAFSAELEPPCDTFA